MKWSLIAAADEFGVARETIRRGLRRNDVEVKSGKKYTTQQVFKAISGDLKFERTRRERAEADRAEVEAAKSKQEVIHQSDVATFIRNTFAPVREDLISMPSQLAARCNPADPQKAREALTEWSDEFIKRRREHIPAIKLNGE